jgi:hypothetical protein
VRALTPGRLILLGLLLVAAGAAVPALVVLRRLPSSLWLLFLAYACSVAGLFLGALGAVGFAPRGRE